VNVVTDPRLLGHSNSKPLRANAARAGRAVVERRRMGSWACGHDAASAMAVPHGALGHGEPRVHGETPGGQGGPRRARRGPEERLCGVGERRSCRGSSSKPSSAADGGLRRRCRAVSASAAACWLLLLVFPPHAGAAPAAIRPFNAPIQGTNVITVQGMGGEDSFGEALSYPKVRIGGTAATSTQWVSATSIIATLPRGDMRYTPRRDRQDAL
jgi:hypothetical protein